MLHLICTYIFSTDQHSLATSTSVVMMKEPKEGTHLNVCHAIYYTSTRYLNNMAYYYFIIDASAWQKCASCLLRIVASLCMMISSSDSGDPLNNLAAVQSVLKRHISLLA